MKYGVTVVLCGWVLMGIGCRAAVDPLPPVEWQTFDEARRIMVERREAIRTVQAQCTLKITPADGKGKTQSLDGAVVMEGETRVRLRAWKFNRAVFDLIVNDEGTFIVVGDELAERAPDAEAGLARLAEHLGGMLRGPDYAEAEFHPLASGARFAVVWDHATATIDNRTLTPVTLELSDPDGSIERRGRDPKTVRMVTEYADYSGLPWLHRVEATGDFGTIEITFRDVEINGSLNPRAFQPPRRAERL